MQHILLANDTGQTSNPGCQSVRRSVDLLLDGTGMEISGSLPLGFGSEPFRQISPASKACIIVSETSFPIGTETAPPVDLARWKQLREDLSQDATLRSKLQSSDMLLVNGEGSIHHNFPRGLSLLAMIDIAAEMGKPAVLLNSTIQAMDPELLAATLPKLRSCHVRELASHQSIKPYYPQAICAADIAVLAIDKLPYVRSKRFLRLKRNCLISSGVLVRPKILASIFRMVRSGGFVPTYFSVGDGGETDVAVKVARECEADLIHASDFRLDDLPRILSDFDMSVSGRHHLNLLLMRAGVPVVPLPSNTWKIEETLSSLSYPLFPVRDLADLPNALDQAWNERRRLAEAGRAGIATAVRSLDGLAANIFH